MPRSRGGRETVDLHPICHRKIHTVLTEKEIAESYATIEALRGHPEVARFVRWVARKDPDWHGRTAASRRLRERR